MKVDLQKVKVSSVIAGCGNVVAVTNQGALIFDQNQGTFNPQKLELPGLSTVARSFQKLGETLIFGLTVSDPQNPKKKENQLFLWNNGNSLTQPAAHEHMITGLEMVTQNEQEFIISCSKDKRMRAW